MFKSEKEFEDNLIDALLQKGWTDVLVNPTEENLINNWANILFNNNRGIDRLNGYPLVDSEMQQILEQINLLKTPAKLNDFINGRTISIRRENPDDKLHFGKEVSLKIYDRLEIAGGESTYQIARQPQFKSKTIMYPERRGDVMLLINGMPVIHIELKRSGIDVSQAVNQIKKYYSESVFTGLYSLVQIFVAMTPEKTLYFANPGDVKNFNPNYYFTWADFYNEPINNWKDIAFDLLSIPMAHTLIGFYTIADNTDGLLKVMRSYQYNAAREISTKISKIKWGEKNIHGGYVSHTTGSGKTLTSFKSAELIANMKTADKVIFLVDRIEIGTQSLQQYRNFAGNSVEVQSTEDTYELISRIKSNAPADTLIVTSIQKMSNIEEDVTNKKDIELMNKKRIVFVVDEAHRSTFGIMLQTIKKTFPKAVFFGFTGTPIHEINAKYKSTTADVFGDELHRYSIADGIRDKNVLGFDTYAVSTYRDRDLRIAVALYLTKSNNLEDIFKDPKKVEVYNRIMELPMSATKDKNGNTIRGIEDYIPMSQYRNEKHRKAVVKDVIDDWIRLSRNGRFHALFATSSIKEASEYYALFKEMAPNLKVAALFDPSDQNNEEGDMNKADNIVEMLTDYNNMFNQRFTYSTYPEYKKDVALRLAHKSYYKSIEHEPEKILNILIVVNQMLTGYDSKWINTLYLDKVLVHEQVIQSFSRTNRIFGPEKPFGIIKYYRKTHTMEQNIKDAFKNYSGDNPFGIFVDNLYENLVKVNDRFLRIKDIFYASGILNFEKNPEDEESRRKFAVEFRDLTAYLEASKIQGFVWNKLEYNFSKPKRVLIDEETYQILLIRYKELFMGKNIHEKIPYPIETHITERDTGQINYDYMNSKFEKYIEESKNKDSELLERVLNELHKSFAFLSQEQQKYADIFLADVKANKIALEKGKTFMDYVIEYMDEAKDNRINRFCSAYGINKEAFLLYLREHNPYFPDEYGRKSTLKESINFNIAKEYLEKKKKNIKFLM